MRVVSKRNLFVMALVVSFICLSLAIDRSARGQRTVTGMVTAWRTGKYIAVSRGRTDLRGFEIGLHPNTVVEGNTDAIQPGARVTVWYRNVAERRLMADRVRVLDAALR